MTAGRFSSAIALGLRQLTDKGETATLTRRTPTAGAENWRAGAATVTTYSVKAAFLNDTRSRTPEDSVTRRSEVMKVLISASGLTIVPEPTTDRVTRADGTEYEIVEVKELAPNEDKILYTLKVRK